MLPKVVLALSLILCVFLWSGPFAYAGGWGGGGGGVGHGGGQNTLEYNLNEGDVVGVIKVREINLNALRAEMETRLTPEQKERMKERLEKYAAEGAAHVQREKDLRDLSIPLRTFSIGLTLGSLYLEIMGAGITIPSNVIITQTELNFLKYSYEGYDLLGLPDEIKILYKDYTDMLRDIWKK